MISALHVLSCAMYTPSILLINNTYFLKGAEGGRSLELLSGLRLEYFIVLKYFYKV